MFLCTGNHTKFIAKTTSIAQEWVESIREGISQEQERERREVQCQLPMKMMGGGGGGGACILPCPG